MDELKVSETGRKVPGVCFLDADGIRGMDGGEREKLGDRVMFMQVVANQLH
ncbi:hypothetical protein PQI66_00465 [Corynebacterium sp. USCH3]